MKSKRFSEIQIVKILREAESGVKILDLCRKYGMSDATFYNWRSKYGGMQLSDIKKLKELEEENGRLKRLVADQALDLQVLKDVVKKF